MSPLDQLTAEFMLELNAKLGERVSLGKSPQGERWVVPITGGEFAGTSMHGEILPGADWQLKRSDGVLEIDARYAIRVSDGAVIHVRNRGIVAVPADPKDGIYVRTVPMFEAPSDGPHAWLNRTVFLGTLALAGPNAVRVRMFKVL